MKVGQRAYLVIKNAISLVGLLPRDEKDTGKGCNVGIVHFYEVHNLGRTPATVSTNEQIVRIPEGWVDQRAELRRKLESFDADRSTNWRGHVSQDSHAAVGDTFSFIVSGVDCKNLAAYVAFQRARAVDDSLKAGDEVLDALVQIAQLRIAATMTFADVFGDNHTIRWTTNPELSRGDDFVDVYIRHLENSTSHIFERMITSP